MNEAAVTIEVLAEIIAKLRSEKMQMAREIEALKARLAEADEAKQSAS